MTATPRLGVLYEPASVQTMHLVEAASGRWETVWLVDRDIADPGGMLRLLRRLGEVVDITGLDAAAAGVAAERPLDGVIAFDDMFLRRAADIAAEHGFASYAPQTALRLTDKELQREAFRAAGLDTPGSARLSADGDRAGWSALLQGLRGPLVVKPAAGSNGSRDVFAVAGADEAVALMVGRAAAGAGADMVAEERIPDGWVPGTRPYGDFVTVEVFASGGELSTFGVTGCMPSAPGFALTGNFMPNALPDDERTAAAELALRAITALGAGTGVYHTEIKLSADGPQVMEVNGRLGGGGVPRIAEASTGRSLLRDACLVALGQQVDVSGARFDQVAYYHRIQPPLDAVGVESMVGLDEVRRLPGVREVEVRHGPGSSLGAATAGTQRYVYSVHGVVADHDELWSVLDAIASRVAVSYR